VEPSPTSLQDGGLNCVTGLGKYKGRLIVLLDMTKLLDMGATKIVSGTENRTELGTVARRTAAGN
jgi:chemotaxis signal transduction protein